MCGYVGFSFNNPPEYPDEEARLKDYLRDFADMVPYDDYKKVIDYFLKNDKKALANYLTKVCTEAKYLRDRIESTPNRMAELAKEVTQLRELAERSRESESTLWREYAKLRLKLEDVYKSEAGLDLRIRDLYVEEKKSLREIAEIVGKDKKTVKKHLDKMEVYERKAKEKEEETIKSLTQHLPKF